MLNRIIITEDSFSLFLLRVSIGIVIFAHGAQKFLGIFGGHGYEWTVNMWQTWFHFPSLITWLVILGEFFGSILLIAGLFTRIMAGSIAVIMFGAIYFVHGKWGFFMNWYSSQDRGEGFEYHILALAILTFLIMNGGGKWSVDLLVMQRRPPHGKSNVVW